VRSILAALRQLVLPANASGTDPRIVIGPDVPSVIASFTINLPDGTSGSYIARAAFLYYLEYPDLYYFTAVCDKTSGFGNDSALITGSVNVSDVFVVQALDHQTFGTDIIRNMWGANADTAGRVEHYLYASSETRAQFFIPGGMLSGERVDNNGSCTVDTTTSATSKQVAGSSVRTLSKHYDSTGIEIVTNLTASVSAINTTIGIGVEIDGTYFEATSLHINVANSHVQISGIRLTNTGLAPGDYACELHWRRVTGAATCNIDTNDRFSWSAREVG
jgi:hypothetical protein